MRTFVVGVMIALLVLGGGAFAGYRYYRGQLHDPHRVGQPAVSIEIPPGTSVSGIAEILSRAGLIDNTVVFEAYVRAHGLGSRLEAGHYSVPGGKSTAEVIALLEHSNSGTDVSVTIPEGYISRQIADVLEKKKLFPAGAYLDALNQPVFTHDFLGDRKPGAGLEGYLFPDTYSVAAKTTPKDVIEMQLKRFGERVPPSLRARSAEHHLTFAEALVMASIIEREARFDADRPVIAGVFYNRLAKGMGLEADATLLFAKGKIGGELTAQDKEIKSPFNTYRNTGLPPSPICNPGLASITAALAPAQHNFVFYLTDKSGHAHFSRTFAEHQQLQVQYGVY